MFKGFFFLIYVLSFGLANRSQTSKCLLVHVSSVTNKRGDPENVKCDLPKRFRSNGTLSIAASISGIGAPSITWQSVRLSWLTKFQGCQCCRGGEAILLHCSLLLLTSPLFRLTQSLSDEKCARRFVLIASKIRRKVAWLRPVIFSDSLWSTTKYIDGQCDALGIPRTSQC